MILSGLETPVNFHEVIVVGGGPAGLSAALVLARCCRQVLVIDSGKPRNWASHSVGGFFTRDGTHPREMLRLGREELGAYHCAEVRDGEVTEVTQVSGRFHVVMRGEAQPFQCRRLLLATGLVDEVPPIDGIMPLYGNSVFHCPICNGWEVRDQPLAVYGTDDDGAELAIELLAWSRDVVLCTQGSDQISAAWRARLDGGGVEIIDRKITRVAGDGGQLECLYFESGDPLARRALFFSSPQHQQSGLPKSLGCKFNEDGTVRKNGVCESTNIPGLYVAGNASACGGTQLAIVAAAQGAEAAHAIHCNLAAEDFKRGRVNGGCD